MSEYLKKRAVSDQKKKEIIDGILEIWINNPSQRLGQLIDNAIYPEKNLFNIEDYDLLSKLKEFNCRK